MEAKAIVKMCEDGKRHYCRLYNSEHNNGKFGYWAKVYRPNKNKTYLKMILAKGERERMLQYPNWKWDF